MNKRVAVYIVLALLLAVIGSVIYLLEKKPNSNPRDALLWPLAIEIKEFSFSPSTLSIKVGDTVIWKNQDSAPHTVTSDDDEELSSPTLNKYDSYSHTFNETGTYDYHCEFHSGMKATIIVSQ